MWASLEDTTRYFDGVDPARVAALRPYDPQPGPYGRDDVEGLLCSWNMHHCYGVEHHRKNPFICVDPLVRYRDLLEGFLEIGRYRFAPYRDFAVDNVDDDAVTILLRHDVDGDIVAAREMARIEAALGIRSTFFVLHTAPYHATFEGGQVHRYEAVVELYREIQELGHEIAIHTDALGLYQDHGLDGADGLRNELAWLRSEGIEITGTLAHNSFGVYGANNYSLFKGRPLTDYFGAGTARSVEHNGRWSPIQELDEDELGLTYEGNEVFWQHEIPVRYWCLMHQGMWARQPDFYGTRLPERLRPPTALSWLSQEEVLDDAASVPSGEIAVLVVHPLHYGLRCHENESPATTITRTMPNPGDWLDALVASPGPTERLVTTAVGGSDTKSRIKQLIGREPKSHSLPITVTAGYQGDRLESTGVYVDYGEGLLDRPADHFTADAAHRVLFVCGTSTGGKQLPSESRVSQLLVRRLQYERSRDVSMIQSLLWAPEQRTSRGFERLMKQLADAPPTAIIAALGADELTAERSFVERLRSGSGVDYPLFALVVPDRDIDEQLSARVSEAFSAQTFDPSPRFDAYREQTGRSLHWASTGDWNHQAHWLAAGLLVEGLEAYFYPE